MNLVSVARSPLGRHVLIYTLGASTLGLLKQTRTVIEGGFALLDHIAGAKAEPAAVEQLPEPPPPPVDEAAPIPAPPPPPGE